MSIDRRASGQERRRRVIYQTSRDVTPETAAERRTAERLREARRPTASYGSHVNRRLRGRWFSLVPVGRTSMSICGLVIFGSAMVLMLLHWASVTWQPLANNAELARPLRLDRADSFGSWAKSFYLAAAAATALLVYQLRRYKVDDYTGSYRIWRTVILLIAIMSVDSVCNLVPWMGAMIDAVLGRRLALSGADWIRILLTVGGGALALRLITEVRRSRIALAMMLVASIGFAIPLLSHWKFIDTTSMRGWLMATSSPLLAAAALWISIGGYLRMLFREVRGLDEAKLASQLEIADPSKASKVKADREDKPRRWFRRAEDANDTVEAKAKKPRVAAAPKAAPAPVISKPEKETETTTKPRWSWFSFRRSDKSSVSPSATNAETRSETPAKLAEVQRPAIVEKSVVATKPEQKPEPPLAATDSESVPKRSWFSLRRSKPKEPKEPQDRTPSPIKAAAAKSQPTSSSDAAAPEKPARKGIGSWLRRDSAPKDATLAAQVNPAPNSTPKPASPPASADSDDDDEDDMSDDSVDWGSMNKSERRRMRKEIKRGGRAA